MLSKSPAFRVSSLEDLAAALRAAGDIDTLILDIEPAVCRWKAAQDELWQSVERALGLLERVPTLKTVFFITNSNLLLPSPPDIRPSRLRIHYEVLARKPFCTRRVMRLLRTASTSSAGGGVLVCGDQPLTDGLLAWRLGATFAYWSAGPGGPRWSMAQQSLGDFTARAFLAPSQERLAGTVPLEVRKPHQDTDSVRLAILLADYSQARDDDRNFVYVEVTLLAAAITFLSVAGAILSQSCALDPGATCRHLPDWAAASLPLPALAILSVLTQVSVNATLRNFYLRGLERELIRYTDEGLGLDRRLRFPSLTHLTHGVGSLRQGMWRYRVLTSITFAACLVLFGGIAVLGIVSTQNGAVRALEGAAYGSATCLLILDSWTGTVGGRSLWIRMIAASHFFLAQSLTASRPQQWREVLSAERRRLITYLLLPRIQDFIVKIPFLLTALILSGAVTGHLSDHLWTQYFLVVFLFEFLVYQARYQWNDIRDFAEDQAHPEAANRRRLPGPASRARSRVAVSAVVAVAKLALAVAITLTVLDPAFRGPMIVSSLVVFLIGAVYEWVRDHASNPDNPVSKPDRWQWGLIFWVGAGYALRFCTGLWVGSSSEVDTGTLVTAAAAMWSYGVMLVSMTWALEATAYMRSPNRYDEGLKEKSHLGCLAYFQLGEGDPSGNGGDPLGATSILAKPGPILAPWNVALLVAGAAAALLGVALTDHLQLQMSLSAQLSVVAVGALAALLASRTRTSVAAPLTVIGVVVYVGLISYSGGFFGLIGGIPLAAVLFLHVYFRVQSYAKVVGLLGSVKRLARRLGLRPDR